MDKANLRDTGKQGQKMDKKECNDYTVIDLEMTGLAPSRDHVIEIGAVRVRGGEIVDTYGTLVNARHPIPQEVVELTGITEEMEATGKPEDEAMRQLLAFIGDDLLVGHNISFDYSFIRQWTVNQRLPLELYACDTLRIARGLLPEAQSKSLENLCTYFGIKRENAHRALDDAVETQQVFECLKRLEPMKEALFTPRLLTYRAKRQTPATEHQKERLRELMEQRGITYEVGWETLTRSEASRLYDRIRSGMLSASQE
jgi:DNA polymerase-3 subunit alpha (Gram-positive type)